MKEYIQLLPEVEDVFIENHEQYRKHFMPLLTIDLKGINENLNGKIHLVYFNNDPYCTASASSFNEYCDDYKVTFDIIDNKYRFKTDFSYFKTNQDWIEWLDKGRKSYQEIKASFKSKPPKLNSLVKRFGKKPRWVQSEEHPLDEDKNPLTFVCQVWSGDFVRDNCAEEIYLFYDSKKNRAVQIHQID
jgi:hypothetical protein